MKKILLIGIFVFTIIQAKTQIMPTDTSSNFYDFMTKYYNLNPSMRNDTTHKSGIQKEYDRLAMIWVPRLYPHGNCTIAANAIYDYTIDFNNSMRSNNQFANMNWKYKGPVWQSNAGNQSGNLKGTGQIHRITFDPGYNTIKNGDLNKTIYAASSFGGLFRSTDDGAHWKIVNTDIQLPQSGVADIAVDYQDSHNLFIATGYADGFLEKIISPNWGYVNPISTVGMYRSTDNGANWQTINGGFLNNFQDGGVTRRMIINPLNGNILFAATTEGVFKTDNALTINASDVVWDKKLGIHSGIANNDRNIRGLEYKPGDTNIVYASGIDIYISTDAGATWNSMTGTNVGLNLNTLPDNFIVGRINIAVTPADPERLYAYIVGTYTNGSNQGNKMYIYN